MPRPGSAREVRWDDQWIIPKAVAMTDLCVNSSMTSNPPQVSPQRRLAWQLALFFPCVVICVVATVAPPLPLSTWQTVSGIILLGMVGTAAVTDFIWLKIPNWITYSALGWAILINAVSHLTNDSVAGILGAVGLADSLAGAFIPFFFMLVIFSLTGGGAGDVKLTAAMGALLGLNRVIDAILLSFVFAGGFALMRGVWLQGPKNLAEMVFRKIAHWIVPLWVLPPNAEQISFMKQAMPLGPSFAAGTLLVVFNVNLQQLLESLPFMWGPN